MTTCTTFWRTCRRFAENRGQISIFPWCAHYGKKSRSDPMRPGRLGLAGALALGVLVAAQDGWPTYHGDYSGQRHSRLTQVTPANVHQLTLAWAFQTGQTQQIKSTPILVNGVIYVTAPDNIWALDAH